MNSLFKTITASQMAANDAPSVAAQQRVETRLFVRDLEVMTSIGVYDTEKTKKQPVIINAELIVEREENWQDDSFNGVVSYEIVVDAARAIAQEGHIELVETFAEKLIEACFTDERVKEVSISVEKPAIFDDAFSAGVEITRHR